MSKKNKEQILGEKVISKLGDILTLYNEVYDTVSNQKAFQTLDYDELIDKIETTVKGATVLRQVTEKKKIEIPDLQPLVIALGEAVEAYQPIIEGLAHKANRTGRYGWLAYRRDTKKHDAARRKMIIYSQLFARNIETAPDEPVFVEATAHVLSPLSDDVLVETMEIPEEDYQKFKDRAGAVYAMRAYENGEPKTMLLEKKMWQSMKSTFVRTAEQQQADLEKIKSSLFEDK